MHLHSVQRENDQVAVDGQSERTIASAEDDERFFARSTRAGDSARSVAQIEAQNRSAAQIDIRRRR
jgi:hypothetical protein